MDTVTKLNTPPLISGSVPLIGHALKLMKKPLKLLQDGYEEKGSIFSINLGNKKGVIMLGPENNKFFFHQTDKLLSIKEGYPFFQKMFSEDFYFLGQFEQYKEQRNVIIPCFKQKQIHSYMDVMIYETIRFMEDLGDEGIFDLIPKFGPLVMNIAAHSFLGNNFRKQLGEDIFDEFREFSDGMDAVLPPWLPLPKFKRSQFAKKKLHRKLQNLIDERRKNPVIPTDFFQTITSATYSNGKAVEDDVIINLILLLVWAGHETTAGHVSWALIDLLQNPNYMETLIHQQTQILGNRITFGKEESNQLKTIDWAIKETERLHPVAYVLMRRAKEDFELNEYLIEKGSLVFAAPSVSHMMENVFENPTEYNPLRFSDPNNIPNHSLIGFGGGVHRCAGVNFAYLEMKIILTILLQRYNFQLLDKNPTAVTGSRTKWPESPTRVKYQKRKDAMEISSDKFIKKLEVAVDAAGCPFHNHTEN